VYYVVTALKHTADDVTITFQDSRCQLPVGSPFVVIHFVQHCFLHIIKNAELSLAVSGSYY